MDQSVISHLESFLEDIPFPIDKEGLVQEAFDSPLPSTVREAIALLPDKEYISRAELKEELIGMPFDDGAPKKDAHDDLEDVDDVPDSIVGIDDFTPIGDEEDHENV